MVRTHIVESMWFRRRVILQKIPCDSRVLDMGRHFGLVGSSDEKRECNDDCEDQEEGTVIEIRNDELEGAFLNLETWGQLGDMRLHKTCCSEKTFPSHFEGWYEFFLLRIEWHLVVLL